MNKNTQTTSTKCQYQIAASNPLWWCFVKWWLKILEKQTIKNVVPTKTWNPWNPVAKKNVDPNVESAIVNGASKYSSTWRPVKTTPNANVKNNEKIVLNLSPEIIEWCDHVIVAPDVNKIAVLSKGTSNAEIGTIPTGGQTPPISIAGPNELWKKAQKNEKKNMISETMNNNIPCFNPLWTT